jgi:hypothetical protein
MSTTPKYEVFNADDRDADRTSAGLKLGGKLYRRARRNNKVQRQIRRLGRDQSRLLEEIDELRKAHEQKRLRARIRDAKKDEDATEVVRLEGELKALRDSVDEDAVDEVQDQYEETLFRLLELLLGEAEDGSRLTADELADGLDIEDAAALSRQLMGVNDAEDRKAAEDAEDDAEDPT